MVKLLKASGSEVVMVMKAGVLHSEEEKRDLEDVDSRLRNSQVESTNGTVAEESCDSLDCLADSSNTSLERIQAACLSTGSDSDVSSPGFIPARHTNLQRTSSNPLLDGERSKVSGMGVARRLSDGPELEETDGGDPRRKSECPLVTFPGFHSHMQFL